MSEVVMDAWTMIDALKWMMYLAIFVVITRRVWKYPKPQGWVPEPEQDR